mgnify:FL=1
MAKRLQRPQNKRRSAAVIAVAAAVALASVAVAFMLRRAEVQSDFTPAVVTCAVHEKVNGAEVTGSAASGSVKSDITAENTGSTTVFLRLRLSACWVDGTGKVTGTPSVLPKITLRQNWLDGGDGLYYYALPVKPGESTAVLCEPMRMETSVSPTGATVYQQITVLAEAVQALPEKAAQEAWGVTVENGRITAVK